MDEAVQKRSSIWFAVPLSQSFFWCTIVKRRQKCVDLISSHKSLCSQITTAVKIFQRIAHIYFLLHLKHVSDKHQDKYFIHMQLNPDTQPTIVSGSLKLKTAWSEPVFLMFDRKRQGMYCTLDVRSISWMNWTVYVYKAGATCT